MHSQADASVLEPEQNNKRSSRSSARAAKDRKCAMDAATSALALSPIINFSTETSRKNDSLFVIESFELPSKRARLTGEEVEAFVASRPESLSAAVAITTSNSVEFLENGSRSDHHSIDTFNASNVKSLLLQLMDDDVSENDDLSIVDLDFLCSLELRLEPTEESVRNASRKKSKRKEEELTKAAPAPPLVNPFHRKNQLTEDAGLHEDLIELRKWYQITF
jgi:hypothetical protein